ncbi:PH domain-containing protein [Serinicoccus sediminis]|uniref:PH domain-containing protein n=1 Tax=Serinicoccus sediminis TaxID=2306021 RepID=UPI00101EC334|nr:PH domain-containing protein [Serinicoccus sediminis]
MTALPPPTGEPLAVEDPGTPPVPPGVGGAQDWQRLSPRMLLVHPVRALMSMLVPLVLVSIGANQGDNGVGLWFVVVGGVLALVFGVLAWFFTRYRFTPEQLQLRTGVLSRKVLTAPLDRIRSVDLESTPIHRVLGLTKAKVGTGVDSTQIELDGLTRDQAAALRVYLLQRSAAADVEATDPAAGQEPGEEAHGARAGSASRRGQDTELARIDWGWLRYAPFSLSSLVVVAGAFGVLAQFGDELPVDETEVAQQAWGWVAAQAVAVLVAGVAVVVVLGWVVLSTASYVLNWWNLRLVREAGGKIRTTRGLLTTRSQTIEETKVRGVRMTEQFLLRFVRGAELTALATGVGGEGTARLLPPAPRRVVQEVGHALLDEDGPLTMTLTGHGPRARRRIHVSRQWGTLVLAVLVAVPTWWLDVGWFGTWPWWLPFAVLVGLGLLNAVVAEQAWRNLGHALTDRHLVVQTGALIRTREVLERAGVIGWVVHQGLFQRRLGLADLTATTAAGPERVVAPNIPLGLALDLADATTPGMLEGWRA